MAETKKPLSISVGYTKASQIFNRTFTFLLSLVLLVLSSPLFLIVALVIKIQDKGPVFYSGLRLGKNKKPFRMYKFRTLVPEAPKLIGSDLFTTRLYSNRDLLTRTGSFLRETRLDELPQFINTLKGDMDLIGPRPERPEVYEKFCRHIKGYDKRFIVRPGLIGYSQLFTPHSSPKRIRNLLDNRFLQIKHRYLYEFFLVFYTLVVMTWRLFLKILSVLWGRAATVYRHAPERRALNRQRTSGGRVIIRPGEGEAGGRVVEGELKDINEEAVCVLTDSPVPSGRLELRLTVPTRKHRDKGPVKKTALCRGEIYRSRVEKGDDGRHVTVLRYTPVSPLNYYMVHQYFIHSSVIH